MEEKELISAACGGKAGEQTPASLEIRLHTRDRKQVVMKIPGVGKA